MNLDDYAVSKVSVRTRPPHTHTPHTTTYICHTHNTQYTIHTHYAHTKHAMHRQHIHTMHTTNTMHIPTPYTYNNTYILQYTHTHTMNTHIHHAYNIRHTHNIDILYIQHTHTSYTIHAHTHTPTTYTQHTQRPTHGLFPCAFHMVSVVKRAGSWDPSRPESRGSSLLPQSKPKLALQAEPPQSHRMWKNPDGHLQKTSPLCLGKPAPTHAVQENAPSCFP